ncbi:hypothetical protein KIPB_016811, partial [Kipferlia bialata]|eukprot:g16811.t1
MPLSDPHHRDNAMRLGKDAAVIDEGVEI